MIPWSILLWLAGTAPRASRPVSSCCATAVSPSSNASMTVSDLSVALDPATVRRTTLPNGLRVLVRRDASAPVVAIVTYVSAGYFDETDDVVGHRARARAHVLQGHADARRGRDRAADEGGRRLPQRGDDLRSHQLLHGAAVVELRGGARRAVRRVRQLADRRGGAGARARGDHPGGEAEGGQPRRGGDGDAVRSCCTTGIASAAGASGASPGCAR